MTYRNLDKPTINGEGREDVVQHAHPDNGTFHFTSAALSSSQDFILIDLSDTTNYPHTNAGYIHIEWLRIHADADTTGSYNVEVGYLKNVDATNGDFVVIADLNLTKLTSTPNDTFFPYYPNGSRCIEGSTVGGVQTNDTGFQTDVNLASTLDPSTKDTPSGDGDLALRVTVTSGTITVSVEGSYHTHE